MSTSLGLLCAVSSALFNGSFIAPFKLELNQNVPPGIYTSYTCFGCFLSSMLVLPLLQFNSDVFTDDKILANYKAIIETLEKEKANNSFKGEMIKNIYITSTMGISYKLKLDKHF